MAQHNGGSAPTPPIEAALAILPSLPRPMLSRLVTRMIERIDEIDGDPDLEEDNEDCAVEDGEFDGEEDYCDGGEDRGTMTFLTNTDLREVRRIKKVVRQLRGRIKLRPKPLHRR